MDKKISVVINTLNEEKNIKRAISSVSWANEMLICDMYSEDKTVGIAKKLGAKVIRHRRTNYVEPVRNFAISKASNEWILVLDPDEEIPAGLADKLQQLALRMKEIDYVRIPRKNIIFNKWMKATGWWPDYQTRFFRKGKVKWTDKIHKIPEVTGEGIDLEVDEKRAIIHRSYKGIFQYLERMNRYTTIEASQLIKEGYKFSWKDLINKPLNEFLSRFFANKGYEDGLHGLALSFLQAFSFLTTYLKTWELSGFKETMIEVSEISEEKKKAGQSIDYWVNQVNSKNPVKAFLKNLIQ